MQDLFADQHELMLGQSPAGSARPVRGQDAGPDGLDGQEADEYGQEDAGGGGPSARQARGADASTAPKPRHTVKVGSLRGAHVHNHHHGTNTLSPESSDHDNQDSHSIPHILVEEIQDWGQFQQKLSKTAKYLLPAAILKVADLKIEAWNNIPIPVVHSSKAFERCLVNTSSIIVELVRELREKTVKIVHKFKRVDKDASRNAQAADRTLNMTRKVLTSRLEDMFERSNALINIQQDKLGQVSAELQNDREYLNAKMQEVDDLKLLKREVYASLAEQKAELEAKLSDEMKGIKQAQYKIWQENLLVPELVGKGCKHANLRDFLQQLETSVDNKVQEEGEALRAKGKSDFDLVRNKQKTNFLFLSNLMHEADSKLREENQALEKLLEERKVIMDEQLSITEGKMVELQQVMLEVNPKKLQQEQEASVELMKERLEWIQAEVQKQLIQAEEKTKELLTEFRADHAAREKVKEDELKFTLSEVERQSQSYTQNQIHQLAKLKDSRASSPNIRSMLSKSITTGFRRASAQTKSQVKTPNSRQSQKKTPVLSSQRSGLEDKPYHQPYRRLATTHAADLQEDGMEQGEPLIAAMNTVDEEGSVDAQTTLNEQGYQDQSRSVPGHADAVAAADAYQNAKILAQQSASAQNREDQRPHGVIYPVPTDYESTSKDLEPEKAAASVLDRAENVVTDDSVHLTTHRTKSTREQQRAGGTPRSQSKSHETSAQATMQQSRGIMGNKGVLKSSSFTNGLKHDQAAEGHDGQQDPNEKEMNKLLMTYDYGSQQAKAASNANSSKVKNSNQQSEDLVIQEEKQKIQNLQKDINHQLAAFILKKNLLRATRSGKDNGNAWRIEDGSCKRTDAQLNQQTLLNQSRELSQSQSLQHNSAQEAAAKANGGHTNNKAAIHGHTPQPVGHVFAPAATVPADMLHVQYDVDYVTRGDIEDLSNILQAKIDIVVKENMLAARNDLVKMMPAPEKDTNEPAAGIKQYIMKQIEKQIALTVKAQVSTMVYKAAPPVTSLGASGGSKSTLAQQIRDQNAANYNQFKIMQQFKGSQSKSNGQNTIMDVMSTRDPMVKKQHLKKPKSAVRANKPSQKQSLDPTNERFKIVSTVNTHAIGMFEQNEVSMTDEQLSEPQGAAERSLDRLKLEKASAIVISTDPLSMEYDEYPARQHLHEKSYDQIHAPSSVRVSSKRESTKNARSTKRDGSQRRQSKHNYERNYNISESHKYKILNPQAHYMTNNFGFAEMTSPQHGQHSAAGQPASGMLSSKNQAYQYNSIPSKHDSQSMISIHRPLATDTAPHGLDFMTQRNRSGMHHLNNQRLAGMSATQQAATGANASHASLLHGQEQRDNPTRRPQVLIFENNFQTNAASTHTLQKFKQNQNEFHGRNANNIALNSQRNSHITKHSQKSQQNLGLQGQAAPISVKFDWLASGFQH